eukprot:862533_1
MDNIWNLFQKPVAVQTITDTQNQNLSPSKQGYTEWKITGDLLQQVKNATQGQEFISPEFETIDGAKWQIILRPLKNGWMIQPGCILKCVTLSANKAKIGVNVLFNIMELDKSGVDARTFTKPGEIYKCLSTGNIPEQIQNSSALTIQCVVEEAMDVSTSDALFEWKITKHFLQKWKNAKKGECFYSPIFNAIGHEWELWIYPNGKDAEGTAHLKIICNDLKKGDCVSVCYYTDTIGLDSDVCQIGLEKTIKKTEDENVTWIVCGPPFNFNDIQNQSEINIAIRLRRTELMNKDQLRSIANLYSNQNKKISPKAWREYFVASPTQITKWLLDLGLLQYVAIFKEKGYEKIGQLQGLSCNDFYRITGVYNSAHHRTIIKGVDLITTFLTHLGLKQYAPMFEENDYKTMEDMKEIDKEDLKDIGIKSPKHRKTIIKGISDHFAVKPGPTLVQNQEESKENDVYLNQNTNDANSRNNASIPICKNPFVMFLGMRRYSPENYPDLDDIMEDEECLSEVFEGQFKYRFVTNDIDDDGKYNQIWTKEAAEDWIEFVRNNEIIQNNQVKYDALIFCGASHGSIDAMICSDGKELKFKDIRSLFARNVNKQFDDIPKIFIFNSCRTKYQKPTNARAGDSPATGYTVSITGTEGNEVYGPKLSRCVADAFAACCAKGMNVHRMLHEARQNAEKEHMAIRLQEYDNKIDFVVFEKHAKGRGPAYDPLLNTDDDLTNLLRPQKGSKQNLLNKQYYDALSAAGFTNNAKLRALTDKNLIDNGIKLVFHRKELLKRAKALPKGRHENEQKEDDNGASKAHALLKEWGLHKYAKKLIDEKGYDDVTDWPDLTEDKLVNDFGFAEGHAKRLVKRAKALPK